MAILGVLVKRMKICTSIAIQIFLTISWQLYRWYTLVTGSRCLAEFSRILEHMPPISFHVAPSTHLALVQQYVRAAAALAFPLDDLVINTCGLSSPTTDLIKCKTKPSRGYMWVSFFVKPRGLEHASIAGGLGHKTIHEPFIARFVVSHFARCACDKSFPLQLSVRFTLTFQVR